MPTQLEAFNELRSRGIFSPEQDAAIAELERRGELEQNINAIVSGLKQESLPTPQDEERMIDMALKSAAYKEEGQAAYKKLAEEQGPAKAFTISAGKGMYDVARGVGRLAGADYKAAPEEKAAMGALEETFPKATTVGQIVGESAPLAPLGTIAGAARLARPAQVAAQAILGGAESGLAAAGREATPEEIAKASAIGGVAAGAAEIILPAAAKGLIRIIKKGKAKLIKNALKKGNINQFYDESGSLLPDIKEAIEKSGIPWDEVEKFLPQNIGKAEPTRETIGTIAETSMSKFGKGKKMAKISEEAKPSEELWKIADDFGLGEDIPLSNLTLESNPIYAAIEQSVKSAPTNVLKQQEADYIKKLASKADDIVREFGGKTEISDVNKAYRFDALKVVDDLKNEATKLYGQVNEMVNPSMVVDAAKTKSAIINTAREMIPEGGDIATGIKRLSPLERKILTALRESDVTYRYLDSIRKDVGRALHNKQGPFVDEKEGILKYLYKQLSSDQYKAIPTEEAKALYNTARATVAQRKAIEKQLVKTIGKDAEGDIIKTANAAVKSLMTGETKQFNNLAKNIPKNLGPETRQQVFASALNDVMTLGSRGEKQLNIAGFDDFMKGLKRNPENKRMLAKELPPSAMDRLEAFHELVGTARKAKGLESTTGKLVAAPEIMDEIENVWSKLYGFGRDAMIAEGIGFGTTGVPGVGTMTIAGATLGSKLLSKNVKKSAAADALLASRKFRSIMRNYATGKVDNPAKRANLDKMLNKVAQFRNWKKTLSKAEKINLNKYGAIGFLTGAYETKDIPVEDMGYLPREEQR